MRSRMSSKPNVLCSSISVQSSLKMLKINSAFMFVGADYLLILFKHASKMLNIVFTGESAVDDRGPRREFFQLLMQEAFSKSGLFVGWPDHVVPIHQVEAAATCTCSNQFYIIGKMVSTCLAQGGQPPVCLAGAGADYLVYEAVRSDPCVADIPDYSMQQKLEKVHTYHCC